MDSTVAYDLHFTENETHTNSIVESDDILMKVEENAVPVICVLGLIGNTVSAVVFSRRTLRDNSSSLFLVIRSLSDNGFLATLLTIWASSVYKLDLGKTAGLCRLLIFLTYFFGGLSVWLVVFVTAENYIRICKPFLVRKICTITKARISVIILVALTFGIYNFPLWTIREICEPDKKYYGFIQVMTYADSVLTLIVPSTVMAVLMSVVGVSAIASCRRRRRMSTSSISSNKSPLTKVTRMLLAVTLTFFILNLPYHAVRLRLMIITFVEKQDNTTTLPFQLALQSVSQMLYYLSMSVNVVIYASFSSRFRITLKNLILMRDTNDQAANRITLYKMQRTALSLPERLGNRISGNSTNELHVEEAAPLRRFRSSYI